MARFDAERLLYSPSKQQGRKLPAFICRMELLHVSRIFLSALPSSKEEPFCHSAALPTSIDKGRSRTSSSSAGRKKNSAGGVWSLNHLQTRIPVPNLAHNTKSDQTMLMHCVLILI